MSRATKTATNDGPGFQGFVTIGYDFGRVVGEHHYEPVSMRSN